MPSHAHVVAAVARAAARDGCATSADRGACVEGIAPQVVFAEDDLCDLPGINGARLADANPRTEGGPLADGSIAGAIAEGVAIAFFAVVVIRAGRARLAEGCAVTGARAVLTFAEGVACALFPAVAVAAEGHVAIEHRPARRPGAEVALAGAITRLREARGDLCRYQADAAVSDFREQVLDRRLFSKKLPKRVEAARLRLEIEAKEADVVVRDAAAEDALALCTPQLVEEAARVALARLACMPSATPTADGLSARARGGALASRPRGSVRFATSERTETR